MRHVMRRATPYYALIQALYWAVYCLMVSFASVFMLDRGFTNGQIGLVLGLSYLFSAILQPVVGAFFSRRGIPLNRGIAFVYAPVALSAIVICALPLGRLPVAVLLGACFTVQSMLQPSINALHQSFETEHERVDFGLARGIGSAAFALTSFVMGRLLAHFAPGILPGIYGGAIILLMAVLLLARTGKDGKGASISRGASYGDILRAHPHMGLFMAGVACMFLVYSFIDAFLVQIIVSIGGNSSNLGTAITLSAMTELPAMILFSRVARRGKGMKLFMVSVWFWLAKDVLTMLAPSPQVLYVVQLVNFASVAMYVPGMMDYMHHVLPEDQLLRGATLAGTSATVGSLIATIMGGWLMDLIGVRGALGAMQGFAVIGPVLMTLALSHAIRHSSEDTVKAA